MNIFLDGAVVEHFMSKAGDRGYQTLINEALKQAIQAESLEGLVCRTIREELRRDGVRVDLQWASASANRVTRWVTRTPDTTAA